MGDDCKYQSGICLWRQWLRMYFVGDFDGHRFVCDTKPEVVKWLDWGKDHYATVCFSNTDNRIVAVPWMSNWQYANYYSYTAVSVVPMLCLAN